MSACQGPTFEIRMDDPDFVNLLSDDSVFHYFLDTLDARTISSDTCDFILNKICMLSSSCLEDPNDSSGKLSVAMKVVEKLMESCGVTFSNEQSCRLLGPLLLMCSELKCISTLREAALILNRLLINYNFLIDVANENSLFRPSIVKLGNQITSIGDYECQAVLLECMVRISSHGTRAEWATQWFSDEDILRSFVHIVPKEFERECRGILNSINKHTKLVFSAIAQSVYLGNVQLKKPHGYEFWIDFNHSTKSVSFYVMDPNIDESEVSAQWETIILNNENVKSCYLERKDGKMPLCQVLVVRLRSPFYSTLESISTEYSENSQKNYMFMLTFWKLFDIYPHLQQIFGDAFMGWDNHENVAIQEASNVQTSSVMEDFSQLNLSQQPSQKQTQRSRRSTRKTSVAEADYQSNASRASLSTPSHQADDSMQRFKSSQKSMLDYDFDVSHEMVSQKSSQKLRRSDRKASVAERSYQTGSADNSVIHVDDIRETSVNSQTPLKNENIQQNVSGTSVQKSKRRQTRKVSVAKTKFEEGSPSMSSKSGSGHLHKSNNDSNFSEGARDRSKRASRKAYVAATSYSEASPESRNSQLKSNPVEKGEKKRARRKVSIAESNYVGNFAADISPVRSDGEKTEKLEVQRNNTADSGIMTQTSGSVELVLERQRIMLRRVSVSMVGYESESKSEAAVSLMESENMTSHNLRYEDDENSRKNLQDLQTSQKEMASEHHPAENEAGSTDSLAIPDKTPAKMTPFTGKRRGRPRKVSAAENKYEPASPVRSQKGKSLQNLNEQEDVLILKSGSPLTDTDAVHTSLIASGCHPPENDSEIIDSQDLTGKGLVKLTQHVGKQRGRPRKVLAVESKHKPASPVTSQKVPLGGLQSGKSPQKHDQQDDDSSLKSGNLMIDEDQEQLNSENKETNNDKSFLDSSIEQMNSPVFESTRLENKDSNEGTPVSQQMKSQPSFDDVTGSAVRTGDHCMLQIRRRSSLTSSSLSTNTSSKHYTCFQAFVPFESTDDVAMLNEAKPSDNSPIAETRTSLEIVSQDDNERSLCDLPNPEVVPMEITPVKDTQLCEVGHNAEIESSQNVPDASSHYETVTDQAVLAQTEEFIRESDRQNFVSELQVDTQKLPISETESERSGDLKSADKTANKRKGSLSSASTVEAVDPQIILISEDEGMPRANKADKSISTSSIVNELTSDTPVASDLIGPKQVPPVSQEILKAERSLDAVLSFSKASQFSTQSGSQVERTEKAKKRARKFVLYKPDTAPMLSISPSSQPAVKPSVNPVAVPRTGRRVPKKITETKSTKKGTASTTKEFLEKQPQSTVTESVAERTELPAQEDGVEGGIAASGDAISASQKPEECGEGQSGNAREESAVLYDHTPGNNSDKNRFVTLNETSMMSSNQINNLHENDAEENSSDVYQVPPQDEESAAVPAGLASKRSGKGRRAAVESQRKTKKALESPSSTNLNSGLSSSEPSVWEAKSSGSSTERSEARKTKKKSVFSDIETTSSDVSWMKPTRSKGLRLFETPIRTYKKERKKKTQTRVTKSAPQKRTARNKKKKETKPEENSDWIYDKKLANVVSEYPSIENFDLVIDRTKRSSTTEFSKKGREDSLSKVDAETEEIDSPASSYVNHDGLTSVPGMNRKANHALSSSDNDVGASPVLSPKRFLRETEHDLSKSKEIQKSLTEKRKNITPTAMRRRQNGVTSVMKTSSPKMRAQAKQSVPKVNMKNKKSPSNEFVRANERNNVGVNVSPSARISTQAPHFVEEQEIPGTGEEVENALNGCLDDLGDENQSKQMHLERFLNHRNLLTTQDVEIAASQEEVKKRLRLEEEMVASGSQTRSKKQGSKKMKTSEAANQIQFNPKMSGALHENVQFPCDNQTCSGISSTSSSCSSDGENYEETSTFSPEFYNEVNVLIKRLICTIQKLKSNFYENMHQYRRELFYAIEGANFETDFESRLSLKEQAKIASAHRRAVLRSIRTIKDAMDAFIDADKRMQMGLEDLQKRVLKKYARDAVKIKERAIDRQEKQLLKDMKKMLFKFSRRLAY